MSLGLTNIGSELFKSLRFDLITFDKHIYIYIIQGVGGSSLSAQCQQLSMYN